MWTFNKLILVALIFFAGCAKNDDVDPDQSSDALTDHPIPRAPVVIYRGGMG